MTKYLGEPTEAYMKRILFVDDGRGFPGCLDHVYWQYWQWNNFPVAWAGQFKGNWKRQLFQLRPLRTRKFAYKYKYRTVKYNMEITIEIKIEIEFKIEIKIEIKTSNERGQGECS